MNTQLFSPFTLRELTIRNRIFISPMCQYSCVDGLPGDWHLVHYGSRAIGGSGLVMVEATAVSPEARISLGDSGLWNNKQAEAWAPIAEFIKEQGATPAIQLAHAGRKASTTPPWEGGKPIDPKTGGWPIIGPSSIPFTAGYQTPDPIAPENIEIVIEQFTHSAELALSAGFEIIEIHMAHGYLLHSFLSPLSNRREDQWGGDLSNRMHFPLTIAKKVRTIRPPSQPIFVRISTTDRVEHGWDLAQSVVLAERLKEIGVDLIDCSSGGLVPDAKIPAAPGFQTDSARVIREHTQIATGAVGLITAPAQAEHILQTGQADAVFPGRELLRDPYWPLHAARELGSVIDWPKQYERAR